MTRRPLISILVGTHNRSKELLRCLGSVFAQDFKKDEIEVVVFDDASADDTRAAVGAFFREKMAEGWPFLTLLPPEPENLQIAAVRRRLTAHVHPQSAYVLFIDDDAALGPRCLSILMAYLQEHPEAGVAGPRFSARDGSRAAVHTAHFVNSWTGRYSDRDSDAPLRCDWLNSSAILVRKSALEKIEGFWPGYYTAHEDVDFCLQMKEAGFQVAYVPRAAAYHDADLKRPKRQRLYYLYRNKAILLRRRFPFLRRLTALAVYILLGCPRYVAESIKFHKGLAPREMAQILSAIRDGLLMRSGPKAGLHG